MNKLMMVAIGMVACSMVTGCWTGAVSKGGTYAALPDPKPDEYEIHWKHENKRVSVSATVCDGWFGIFGKSDKAPWMLRDKENALTFGPIILNNYSTRDKARNAALYNACKQEDCDALIGAMYEVNVDEYGPFFKKATCTVTGWPAKITGVENVANKAK